MVQKADLIDCIQFAYEETRAFAGELSEAERATPGQIDRWAARDVLAHIGETVRQANEALAARLRGEEPPTGLSNDETYERYKNYAWEELLDMVHQAFEARLLQVRELDEDKLNAAAEWLGGRPLWRNIAGLGFMHPLIHLTQNLIERGAYGQALLLNQRAMAMGVRLDTSPDWQGTFIYNTGCYHALMGEKEPALDHLERGLKMAPNLLQYVKDDPDLASLQDDPDFQALLDRLAVPG